MLVLPLLAVLANEPIEAAEHRWAVEVPIGLGMPTGLVGIALDWSPVPYLSLQGGIGGDRTFGLLGDSGGFQWSLMTRLHPLMGLGLSFGAGFSGGPYEWCDSCPFENGDVWRWSHAFWFNFDAALEYRWQSGWAFRALAGGADLLNRDDVTCEENKYQCSGIAPARTSIQPYFGLVLRIPISE